MKIAISGMSGFVGQSLKEHFTSLGHSVIGLKVRDGSDIKVLKREIEGCDVVINLSGANILARWSKPYKNRLISSRINTTKALSRAIRGSKKPPKVFLSASAVGIYDSVTTHSEDSTQYADDFLSLLCQEWEAQANVISSDDVRVCIMRFGVILGKGGGALTKMLLPFKLGLGGILGTGRQNVSWIHIKDLTEAISHLIAQENLKGIFNMTAPEIVTNKEQTSLLAKVLHRPAFFSIPSFAVRLIFGEGASVVLESKAAIPQRLLQSGFVFKYPSLEKGLQQIIRES